MIQTDTQDEEISLFDIFYFFRDNFYSLVAFIVSGLGLSLGYVAIATPSYEAIAQLVVLNASGTTEKVILPQQIALKLKAPSAYASDVLQTCQIEENSVFAAQKNMVARVSATVNKAAPDVVEIKLKHRSMALAEVCLHAVVVMLQKEQDRTNARLIEEKKLIIENAKSRWLEARQLLAQSNANQAASVAYFSTREEIGFWRNKMYELEQSIKPLALPRIEWLSPLSVGDQPVSPKPMLMAVLGLVIGLFAGVLYALGRRWYRIATAKAPIPPQP